MNPQTPEETTYNGLRHSQARCGAHRRAPGGQIVWMPRGERCVTDPLWRPVRACAVLHNVALLQNVPLQGEEVDLALDPDPHPQAFHPNAGAVHQAMS